MFRFRLGATNADFLWISRGGETSAIGTEKKSLGVENLGIGKDRGCRRAPILAVKSHAFMPNKRILILCW
jgi:hypothetical protein